MTQETLAYVRDLTAWYLAEIKRVTGDGGVTTQDTGGTGNPGSSGPPKPPH